MSLIGHGHVRQQLERRLPPVALLTGLPGVGKWALAEHLTEMYPDWDALLLRGKWGVKEAREAGKFVQSAPQGDLRIVAADLAGCSHAAQTAMLKVLEEPPAHARFILVAEPGIALPTISSRAVTFYLAPLTQPQTVAVLEDLGLSAPEAAAAAVLAPGRPGAAYAVAKDAQESRDRVRDVLSAVRDGSGRRVDKLFRKWTTVDSNLLGVWAQEAATGKWRVFTAQDVPKGGRHAGRIILKERAASNARPQISDRRIIDLAMQQQLI